jgi:hypothetical protein
MQSTPIHFLGTNKLSKSYNSQSFTLTAATAKLLVPQNPVRNALFLGVTGTAPCAFKFGSVAPVSATDGMTLDPASVSGGQGGSLLLTGVDTPVDAIWAYSTTGTTVTVLEFTEYA